MNSGSDIPLLTINNISLSFKGNVLFRDLSLEVYSGVLFGITGPSGSGKSSLLRVISGLIDPSAGEIRYKGQPRENGGWQQFRRDVILLEQQPLLFEMTVAENLILPWTYKVADNKSFPRDLAIQMLKAVNLDEKVLNENALELSVGQKQRVSLVRALLLEPKIILLDEPTSALDEKSASLVEQLIRQESAKGLGAVIVSHDLEQVQRWCDKVYDIRHISVIDT